MLWLNRSERLGGDAGQLGVAGKTRSSVSIFRRRSSIVGEISALSDTVRGVMNSTSSLRSFFSVWLPNRPPRIGMRLSSGRPLLRVALRFLDQPAHHHRLPGRHRQQRLHRARVDRRRAAGDVRRSRAADLGLHVERHEAAVVDVRRDLQQHAGIDVLRRRRHRVASTLPTIVCWLTGIRLPALIVAFWLSSAAMCGFAMTFVLPYVSSRCSAAWTPPGKFALLIR